MTGIRSVPLVVVLVLGTTILAACSDKLPIVGTDKIDKSASLRESQHVKPGAGPSFTVKAMAAGSYALVCKIAKHYGPGMRAAFTVT